MPRHHWPRSSGTRRGSIRTAACENSWKNYWRGTARSWGRPSSPPRRRAPRRRCCAGTSTRCWTSRTGGSRPAGAAAPASVRSATAYRPLRVRTRVHGTDVVIERSTEHPTTPGARRTSPCTRTPGSGRSGTGRRHRARRPAGRPRLGGPERWTAEVLRRHPGCAVAGYVGGPDSCTVRTRDHGLLQLSAGPDADADPAAYASSLYAWLTAGGTVPPGGTILRMHAAGGVHPVTVEPLPAGLAP
ncbi:hypothetical protein NKH18_27850 [Streptomyces sp. M10(2022)]